MKNLSSGTQVIHCIGKVVGRGVSVIILSCLILFAAMTCFSGATSLPLALNNPMSPKPVINGKFKSSLQPILSFRQGDNWDAVVLFTCSTNVPVQTWQGSTNRGSGIAAIKLRGIPYFSWLCTTNKTGCKVRLWRVHGPEVLSTSDDVRDAFHLPNQTTVSNIIKNTWHQHQETQQWLGPVFPGGETQAYEFTIGDLFPIRIDEEYIVQIVPMLYKANTQSLKLKSFSEMLTNQVTADLVEFPPIYLKLLTNGSVVSLEGPPHITDGNQ